MLHFLLSSFAILLQTALLILLTACLNPFSCCHAAQDFLFSSSLFCPKLMYELTLNPSSISLVNCGTPYLLLYFQFPINQSINHEGQTAWGASPCPLYDATPGSHASWVSTQASFQYWLTSSRRHRLAAAVSSVGVPLASSMLGYHFRRHSDKPDRLPGSAPHAYMAAVSVYELC